MLILSGPHWRPRHGSIHKQDVGRLQTSAGQTEDLSTYDTGTHGLREDDCAIPHLTGECLQWSTSLCRHWDGWLEAVGCPLTGCADTENLTHLPKGLPLPDWEEFTTQRQVYGSFSAPGAPQATHSQLLTWRQVSVRNNGRSHSPIVEVPPRALPPAVLTRPSFQVFPDLPVNSSPTPPGAADLNGCMLGPFFLWKHIFMPSSPEVDSYLICYFVQHSLEGALGRMTVISTGQGAPSRGSLHEELQQPAPSPRRGVPIACKLPLAIF